jgi:L-histidine N-alpha-methyltransferase
VDVYLDPGALTDSMADDVRAGLTATPKTLPPKYFYDARGSELFDEITRLPEYYPTRTERSILVERAAQIAAVTRAETLVELGSGTSEKTRLLLRALRDGQTLQRFVPFDVDPAVLKDASAAVSEEFPDIAVEPVVGDFERHLGELPQHPQRLLAFLGSTIGNLDPAQRAEFLRDVRSTLGPGDAFLLGTDLVKSRERLVAAYDDSAGVTAAFNKNLLAVLNRDLGADFDPDEFDHVAIWDDTQEWIEMRLRSRQDQLVRLSLLDLEVRFARGEELRTEISAKFRRPGVERELAAAGLRLTEWWTDPAADFALSLSVPSGIRRRAVGTGPSQEAAT